MNYPIINTEDFEACTLNEAIALYGREVVPLWRESVYMKPHKIENRRYIGCKAKLTKWIFDCIRLETKDVHVFFDIFAGTGCVANKALEYYDKVVMNDFLYSNNVVYRAFFGSGEWNKEKLFGILDEFNEVDAKTLEDNYFSVNYGGKYFSENVARQIGYIRDNIEEMKPALTEKEYCILVASLIYSMDRIANTLGHFDAYIKKEIKEQKFVMRMIEAHSLENVQILQEDANIACRHVHTDVVYLDPPYNSRQYSRFYHLYEVLVKWDKPVLEGDARKPKAENMSDFCRVKAFQAFSDIVANIDSKYIVVSYNNTYKSKSKSSENKIKLEQIQEVLDKCGKTKVFTHSHNPFNAGKTEFDDHKEYLFITEIDNEKRSRSFTTLLCGG